MSTATPRKRRTRKTTPAQPKVEVIKVTEPKATPVAPEVTTEKKSPDYTKLRGFDFVVLPLIYLEAFVVNFLQNLDVKVPDRVAVK